MLTHTPSPDAGPGTVKAVLGPTNTGKTHLAIERMLGHGSGMIGFPLRLLARENYDKVVQKKGRGQVALVTGEEKILPPNPRYFLCTVESMPVDRPVEFLGVDEIQLCADPERGHVFTDRLLHARGLSETMFMGSDTMRGMIRELVPRAEISSRPRLSTLSYAGARKLTKLPARSAVVAFSASDVYATAELMRRNRGGTAVVLGALSPRTRNAQVQMFEEGEVDYLVATDAIGMGLNLNLDHVAFARLAKFDGRMPRKLTAPEVGQIAGRAGRHMADGTFGTTANIGEIEPEIVDAVESHAFEPIKALCWRNRDLDFKSPQALIKSLEAQPPSEALQKARDAEDYNVLCTLARDPEIARMASDPGAVGLLWEVCQIPDFRKVLSDQHARLLAQIYRYLRQGEGQLPADWVAKQLDQLDKTDGDIDTLVQRIAYVRTWTYITHRGDWLADSAHWQGRARQIEDRLSDALHDTLTNRFVDRRSATLMKRLSEGTELIGAVRRGGEVLVEGEYVGRLQGLTFQLDTNAKGEDKRPLQTAARRALASEIPRRIKQLETDNDGAIALTPEGKLTWRGEVVGRLEPGPEPLKPKVVADDSDFLDGSQRERVRKRLADWFDRYRRNKLAQLFTLAEAELPARARGLAFQLVEALGVVDRGEVAEHVRELGRQERQQLNQLGVRIGRQSLWLPAMLHPRALKMKALLWAVHRGEPVDGLPTDKAAVIHPGRRLDDAGCRALGYRRLEPPRRGRPRAKAADQAVAVRVDALERLAGALHKLHPRGPFTPVGPLAEIVDGDRTALELALPALDYHPYGRDGAAPAFRPKGKPKPAKPKAAEARPRTAKADARPAGEASAEAPAAQADTSADVSTAATIDAAVTGQADGTAGDKTSATPSKKRRSRRRKPAAGQPAAAQGADARANAGPAGEISKAEASAADGASDGRPPAKRGRGDQRSGSAAQGAKAGKPGQKGKRGAKGGPPRDGRSKDGRSKDGRSKDGRSKDGRPQDGRSKDGGAKPKPRPAEVDPNHPFAKLKDLTFAK
jgi:ATP-dependent RNA helicase SUPV3L1/SUV3